MAKSADESVRETVVDLPTEAGVSGPQRVLGGTRSNTLISGGWYSAWNSPKPAGDEGKPDGSDFDRIGVLEDADVLSAVVCDGVGSKVNSGELADQLAHDVFGLSHTEFKAGLLELSNQLPENAASTLSFVRAVRNSSGLLVNACAIGDSPIRLVSGKNCFDSTALGSLGAQKRVNGDSFTTAIRQGHISEPMFLHVPAKPGDTLFLMSDGCDFFTKEGWVKIAQWAQENGVDSVGPKLTAIIEMALEEKNDSSGELLRALRDELSTMGLTLADMTKVTHRDDISLAVAAF